MKEIFRSVPLLVPEGLRGYNGQKLILNLEPNTVRGREGGEVMCKTYDEMIIKWAGRNSRQRRGSTKVSLVTCRAAGRVLHTQRSLTLTTLLHFYWLFTLNNYLNWHVRSYELSWCLLVWVCGSVCPKVPNVWSTKWKRKRPCQFNVGKQGLNQLSSCDDKLLNSSIWHSWDREDLRFDFLKFSTIKRMSSLAQIWPQGAEIESIM